MNKRTEYCRKLGLIFVAITLVRINIIKNNKIDSCYSSHCTLCCSF
ncbi:MAG: hypothetical protein MJ252_09455 [archaeon]|nr:hypothetical protein [archaeon]